MTYFGFLFIFLGVPLVILFGLTLRDRHQRASLPAELRHWSPWVALGALTVIAVLYTTPWDNYLVASRVWWYEPALVTGLVLGWEPVEVYTFFVLQTLFTGLWLVYLARRLPPASSSSRVSHLRWLLTTLVVLLWLSMIILLGVGWQPGTYLALELGWALLPIALQLAFGADILWRHRYLVLLSVAPTTLYLSAADALAINSGTWTINPAFSLEIYIGGVLPLEELLFFFLTNVLITFGMVLALSSQSQERLRSILKTQPARPAREGTH